MGLSENRDSSLRADCASCFGLCCVVPAFTASADFAIDKPAGTPCPNLRQDFKCGIHTSLRQRGFPGCTVYDCFGAGQRVSQVTYGGRDWREAPGTAKQMYEVFPVMRQLHELLWYLGEALTLEPARQLHSELGRLRDEIAELTGGTPEALLELDAETYWQVANVLLLRASDLARSSVRGKRPDRRGADLMGAKLKGADLRGASLRGAYLIGADLRGADLRMADVIGADFRGANLGGADLTGTIFLLQSQLDAAKGDVHTKLSPPLTHPGHWTA